MILETNKSATAIHCAAERAISTGTSDGDKSSDGSRKHKEQSINPDEYGEHLHPSVRSYLAAPISVRLQRVDAGVFIPYPELEVLLNEARWLIHEPRQSRARGIFIGGENGSGKTSIARVLAKEFPAIPDRISGNRHPRVLSINLSGVRTTKALLSHILEAANVPLASSRTIHDHERVVIATLRAMRCSLLITDETQDILMGLSAEQIRVIEVLKRLMNELSLPVLALGTPIGKDAFRADPHMAARFEIYMLPAWQANDKLAVFLATFEQSLPLKYRSDLARTEIQKLLILKTGGCLNSMLKRIRLAAKHAIVDGVERVTKELLERDLLHPPVSLLLGETRV